MTSTNTEPRSLAQALRELDALVINLTARNISPPTDYTFALAKLRYDELEYALTRWIVARLFGDECSRKDAVIGLSRKINPNRPYNTWDCCDIHRKLKTARMHLLADAAKLGVESHADHQDRIATD